MVWFRKAGWPGAQIWYQPGGLEGPNVVTSESDLPALISNTFDGLYGGGELVIDGAFSSGVVQIAQQLDLLESLDVRFTNTKVVELGQATGEALFRNIKSKICSDTPLVVNRTNTNNVSFLQQVTTGGIGPVWIKNIIWAPQDFSATNVNFMVLNSAGTTDWYFEDCSLSVDLTTPSALSRWFGVASVAPSELNLNWYGPNAGQITAGNAQFLSTALTGWDTTVTYGTFGGSLISLAGISWTANAPSIVSRQP